MESELLPRVRIALRNCGEIDPENINDYSDRGGFNGLARALKMAPEGVIEEIARSGLRERGWDGSPVGEKWRLSFNAPGGEKVVICNAVEGDPESRTARTLLECDPYSVLEGMVIGAFATGARLGWIYINAEYGLAISRLRTALKQAEEQRFLGNHLLDSNISFRIEVKEAPGKLACSDETFLLNAIEGKQTMPFVCASHPPVSGLEGKPTLIHQAETWAHVSAVMERGAEWYAGFGTERSRGTRVLSLSGKVMHPGLVEVPMGTPLREIVYDFGGGTPDGKALKAVQIGGPTGGYLPASSLDLPVDFEHLSAAGTLMGSGSILVIDGDACIVDQAKRSLSFIQSESCGKCVFCREGTMQMAEILTDITEGRGKAHDIDLLLELGEGLMLGAQCDLGRTAANPALTAIRHFREELEAHIKDKKCQTRVCKTLEPSA
ncbi:MAG TPA: NADH-ubiquinone oxidoreductase-F iron-sulfur binding region domain-containing protein [Thermodesulfobacteriota bacterium]|nr:NADH-ubiquinone oxidoreductase-F iron-sulfur binding region domain-containing protein [Thermodesulfobacteriota bacterium]